MILGISYGELALLALMMLVAGGVAGFLAGLFGVGGGAVIVPVLYELFRVLHVADEVRMPLCVGTSLAIIIPTSMRSFAAHRAKGSVDMNVLKLWALPVISGVLLGGVIASFSAAAVFKWVFVLVAGFSAYRLLFGGTWRLGDHLPSALICRFYGVIIGVLSSLMGIGGGQLGSMFLTFYGRPIHQAVATSSGLGVLISIPGALGYIVAGWPMQGPLPPLSLGYVSLIGFLLFLPTGVLCAPLGVKMAHFLPRRQLELAFGVFLLIVCLRFMFSLV